MGASTLSILAENGSLLTNVKGKQAIQLSDVNIVLQDGSVDGRTPNGGMILDQGVIEPKEIKSQTDWSNRQLTNKWTVEEVKAKFKGQFYDDAAFSQFLADQQALAISSVNETAIWRGDTSLPGTGTSVNLNRFDGFLKNMKVSGATGPAVNLSGATTGTSIINKLQNGFLACKVEVRTQPDFRLFISKSEYQLYIAALAALNLYVPTADKILFGTDCKMEVVEGLVGTGTVVFARITRLIAGTDLSEDAANAKKYFSPETEKLYIDFRYSLGTATLLNGEIAYAQVA